MISDTMCQVVGPQLHSVNECTFTVWAPYVTSLELFDHDSKTYTAMNRNQSGYWTITLKKVVPGFKYSFRINGDHVRPDPVSQCQVDGVHGPSAVVDHSQFQWNDAAWSGIAIEDAIIYELHTGTFTPEGTFDGVIKRLDHLCELGITAIEIMPVAHFPGTRNWGYDGVHPFAVHTAYGGVDGLKRLVDACHNKGIAVILDVVYNHLGPEGNYIWEYAPYFTQDKYRTPWGWALNFDDADSDNVRHYFISNALYWLETFHIDGLRLDAVHSIYDLSARTFLEELAMAVRSLESQSGKRRMIIAESDQNDPRLIRPRTLGGYGMDAQWSDDLHHAIHTALTGETIGYYEDFGRLSQLAKALQCGYAYCGDYSVHRKRRHGAPPDNLPSTSFVVCSQNHDQIGNRMLGERLITLAGSENARLAAALVLLSPMIPLLFMGEEWGETNPFLYFVNHSDKALNTAVREGRKKEFEAFHTSGSPPDPTEISTFNQSKPNWQKAELNIGRKFLEYYKYLITLRTTHMVFKALSFNGMKCTITDHVPETLSIIRVYGTDAVVMLVNFSSSPVTLPVPAAIRWKLLLSTNDTVWGGDDPSIDEEVENTVTVPAHCLRIFEHNGTQSDELRFA